MTEKKIKNLKDLEDWFEKEARTYIGHGEYRVLEGGEISRKEALEKVRELICFTTDEVDRAESQVEALHEILDNKIMIEITKRVLGSTSEEGDE